MLEQVFVNQLFSSVAQTLLRTKDLAAASVLDCAVSMRCPGMFVYANMLEQVFMGELLLGCGPNTFAHRRICQNKCLGVRSCHALLEHFCLYYNYYYYSRDKCP